MDIISAHINADFDCLGSIVAALKLYPNAKIFFSGSQEKNLRTFLREQRIALPMIKLRGLDWKKVTRVILVDTRNSGRIGDLANFLANNPCSVHIYDHHPAAEDDVHGEFELVDDVGATVTLFTEIFKKNDIAVDPLEATVMALGLYEDTGNFMFQSTTPRDLAAAAWLLESGADLSLVAQYTKKDMTPAQLTMLHELSQAMEIHTVNDIEIVIAVSSTEEYINDLAIIAHKLDDMFTLKVFFLLVRMGDRLSLIARSRLPYIDVSLIARAFGGGGHPSAASASIRDMTLIEAKNRLLQLFKEKLPFRKRARDIMTAPVWTVNADDSLDKAVSLLNRYSINNLPVEENDRLVGIISRQTVDKAIYHGLAGHQVREYMFTDLFPIDGEATAFDARKQLIENNLRFMPVIEGRKVIGVITRTDILRSIYDEDNGDFERLTDPTIGKLLKNISSTLVERLPKEIVDLLRQIGRIGDQLKLNSYVVGGFVRDVLIGEENFDIDLVIEGDSAVFSRRLASALGGRVKIHPKFNTAVVVCPDGFKIDVATARTEYYQKPGALPTIEVSSIKQDLYRRDFTMNTLAVKLNQKEFGILIDFFGSQRDIKDRTIRVLHGLSFVEDPTRVFRAIRFESRYDFSLGKQTLNFIQTAILHRLFLKLSGNRLRTELKLMFEEQNPAKPLARMIELGVLPFIHEKIDGASTVLLFERIREVLLWYNYLYVDEPPTTWMMYMIALIDSLSREEQLEISERFVLPKKIRRLLTTINAALIDELFQLEKNPWLLASRIHRLLSPLPLETVLFMMAKTERDSVRRHISNFLTYYRWQKPFIQGQDLRELGIQPGPHYQEIIRGILDLQLDGFCTSKEEALALTREKYLPLQRYRASQP